jgi:hypothetical protein
MSAGIIAAKLRKKGSRRDRLPVRWQSKAWKAAKRDAQLLRRDYPDSAFQEALDRAEGRKWQHYMPPEHWHRIARIIKDQRRPRRSIVAGLLRVAATFCLAFCILLALPAD